MNAMRTVGLVGWAVSMCLVGGCGGGSDSAPPPAPPLVDPANFVAGVDNPNFPLTPGTMLVYEGTTTGGALERAEYYTMFQTKIILGVTCVVVLSRHFEDGELIEEAVDWYAQDKQGTVWYFGEDTRDIEAGVVVSTAGTWQAGVNGAKPGMMMPGSPQVGMVYYQEYAPGVAVDMGEIVGLNETVTIGLGTFTDCIKIKDTNPLSPGVEEFKYYAPGFGVVLVEEADVDVELIGVTP